MDVGITPDLGVWGECIVEQGGSKCPSLDSGHNVEDLTGWRVGPGLDGRVGNMGQEG